MKTMIYWMTQHLRQTARETRLVAKLWLFKQQVDFLEWRWRLDALMPLAQPIPVPMPTTQRRRYSVHAL